MSTPNARGATSTANLRRVDGSPLRVLVVDDEELLAEAVGLAFESDGWDVRTLNRGREVLFTAREFAPDVIVLDIMMPDLDGFDVLSRVRNDREEARVLFLTAMDSQQDRLAGLVAGGDDYVTKPFSIAELIARARSLARSSTGVTMDPGEARLIVGDLQLDEESRQTFRGGDLIELTATEFDLLRYFARNPRRVLSKEQILTDVWGFDFGATSNVVEMYVSYLRRKIDAGREPMIHTVRGAGYILKPAP
ncbi:response regulator transcription factor [Diaminobutyricibacter tongyongensis]|uniref:Response regulator transcription factor n=1 Tax=Leifsonia tongyongensis TaxID=1268043 RepID=A0A6L9XV09_9MICO|nr:response regulator transcription factor [Diaminobutyricibacter tongyongensis]